MEGEVLQLLPARGLDRSLLLAVLTGLWLLWFFVERLGWVFSGLVVVRLGVATALVAFLDAPIEWVLSVLILDYVLKAVLFVERFRRGSWKRRVV